jgi:hypothetical protein
MWHLPYTPQLQSAPHPLGDFCENNIEASRESSSVSAGSPQFKFEPNLFLFHPIQTATVILNTPTKPNRKQSKRGTPSETFGHKNPWRKLSHRTTHARGKACPHPSQESSSAAQFPPTATARGQGPYRWRASRSLSTDIGHRRSAPAGRPPPPRPWPPPSPAAGDGVGTRASPPRRRLRSPRPSSRCALLVRPPRLLRCWGIWCG